MERELFAARLRDAMNARGCKQVDLVRAAENAGVKLGKSHVSQYVAGKTVPRADVLRFLALTLEVDEDWLRGAEAARGIEHEAAAEAAEERIDRSEPAGSVPQGGTKMREFKKSSKLDNVL